MLRVFSRIRRKKRGLKRREKLQLLREHVDEGGNMEIPFLSALIPGLPFKFFHDAESRAKGTVPSRTNLSRRKFKDTPHPVHRQTNQTCNPSSKLVISTR